MQIFINTILKVLYEIYYIHKAVSQNSKKSFNMFGKFRVKAQESDSDCTHTVAEGIKIIKCIV